MAANFCSSCGVELPHETHSSSPFPSDFNYKSRVAAAVIAITWGIFGIHKFYLRKPIWGILYLAFFWTYIPALVGFVEGLIYAGTEQQKWNDKHNDGLSLGQEKAGLIVIIGGILVSIMFLGILAAIALPAYQDYTVRAKMSEPIAQAAQVKAAVTEYAYANQAWPSSLGDLAGYTGSAGGVVLDGGVIFVNVKAATGLNGSIFLSPSVSDAGTITWTCGSTDIEPKYLPASCRN